VLPGGIGNDSFVRFLSDLPDGLSRDVEVLLALTLLRRHSSIDAPRLSEAVQRSPVETQRDVLARLTDGHRLIEATRRTVRRPFPTYRLRSQVLAAMSTAVAYRRRGVDDIDGKIIEHVREYGSVSNRTVQRTCEDRRGQGRPQRQIRPGPEIPEALTSPRVSPCPLDRLAEPGPAWRRCSLLVSLIHDPSCPGAASPAATASDCSGSTVASMTSAARSGELWASAPRTRSPAGNSCSPDLGGSPNTPQDPADQESPEGIAAGHSPDGRRCI
jgi:hypothetical protein